MASSIERAFGAGAGLMGHGIAQVHAAIGLPFVLYEPDLSRAEAGWERIAANLDRAVGRAGESSAARVARAEVRVWAIVADRQRERLHDTADAAATEVLLGEVADPRLDPYAAADRLLEE